MTQFSRYAIYYTPPPGAFAAFGASWLGWDAITGDTRDHPDIAPLPLDISTITKRPRKYGFHATLKPPFHLADAVTEAELRDAIADLTCGLQKVTLEGLALARMGRMLALRPTNENRELNRLAAEIVQKLDRFRSPPDEQEITRRLKPHFSDRHRELLATWGYPYVLDEFRFHMTLTGALRPEYIDAVQTALSKAVLPLIPQPFVINEISLFGEREDGMFQLLETYPLK